MDFGYMGLILTDVPSEYVANLDIGDTITVSGTISKTPIGWIEIKADSFYKGSDDSADEAKAVYDSLYELKDGFAFIVKYKMMMVIITTALQIILIESNLFCLSFSYNSN